jgi:hypothetical protein
MRKISYSLSIGLLLALTSLTATAQTTTINTIFSMARSATATNANCILDAKGRITISAEGKVEHMHLEVSGLPPKTEFDAFVTQLPNAPFGLSWYQGDLTTDNTGRGVADFVGRFSIETFIVAPGVGPAPVVHTRPIPDANSNPATAPVHTFHVGLWFDTPEAAQAAGCPNTPTPFNGEHNAGIQALSTRNFGNLTGPLSRIH